MDYRERRLADAIDDWLRREGEKAFMGRSAFTSATAAPATSRTLDGMLYQMAVLAQDLEEDPVPVAFRAAPGTLAKLWDALKHHVPVRPASIYAPSGPGHFDGIRLEEDDALPPRQPNWVDVIDHKGRVMKRIVL